MLSLQHSRVPAVVEEASTRPRTWSPEQHMFLCPWQTPIWGETLIGALLGGGREIPGARTVPCKQMAYLAAVLLCFLSIARGLPPCSHPGPLLFPPTPFIPWEECIFNCSFIPPASCTQSPSFLGDTPLLSVAMLPAVHLVRPQHTASLPAHAQSTPLPHFPPPPCIPPERNLLETGLTS